MAPTEVMERVQVELVAIKGNPKQRQLQMQLLCTSLYQNERACRVLRLKGNTF